MTLIYDTILCDREQHCIKTAKNKNSFFLDTRRLGHLSLHGTDIKYKWKTSLWPKGITCKFHLIMRGEV